MYYISAKFLRIHRSALWILGEYACTVEDIHSVMTEFRQCLGEVSRFCIMSLLSSLLPCSEVLQCTLDIF